MIHRRKFDGSWKQLWGKPKNGPHVFLKKYSNCLHLDKFLASFRGVFSNFSIPFTDCLYVWAHQTTNLRNSGSLLTSPGDQREELPSENRFPPVSGGKPQSTWQWRILMKPKRIIWQSWSLCCSSKWACFVEGHNECENFWHMSNHTNELHRTKSP